MPYVKANNLNIFYEEQGNGEPLILLHGGALSHASWGQHVQILKKSFRVITPDSRGHGKTDNPYQEITYRAMADDLKSFMDALRLEKPHVCGFSDGGHIALELAMNYPESFVTLMVSGVHIRSSEPLLKFIGEMGVLGPGKVDSEATVANSSEWFMSNLRIHHAPDSDYWKTLLYQLSFQWFSSPDYSEADFKRVVAPTLVMCGDRDESTPIEQAVEIYRYIPGAELLVAPGCSHVYPLTKPEFFCSLISDFILRRGG